MGIPGLMTFVNNRSKWVMEPFYLHDSYLVIDGNSITSQIYIYYTKGNCAFGGDYDKFARAVGIFFDQLLECGVKPLVLIDGGCELKKRNTGKKRLLAKIETAGTYTAHSDNKFFPLLLKEVFKDVMKEKGIKFAQSLLEADDDIAAISKILNCPVLSFDSDFFIYGVLYIPFNSLRHNVRKNPVGQGNIMECKIYKVEKLLKHLNGIHQSLLPVAAALLGNDYIDSSFFKDFLSQIKYPKSGSQNEQQRKIEAVFNWLHNHSLNSALEGILRKLQERHHKRILTAIRQIIDGYTSLSPCMLIPLGFSKENILKIQAEKTKKPFEFKGDIENPSSSNTMSGDNPEFDDHNKQDNQVQYKQSDQEIVDDGGTAYEKRLIKLLPTWFKEEFSIGNFPSYFIDILGGNYYMCPPQIEDYSYPSANAISFKLITVIYSLLKSDVNKSRDSLKLYIRDQRKNFIIQELEYCDRILPGIRPTLSNLRELPLSRRKKILEETLGILDSTILNNVPEKWKLYLGTAKYWCDEGLGELCTYVHMYALLFCMLFHIVDEKIGFHRSESYFNKKFGPMVESILKTKKEGVRQSSSNNVTIIEAYEKVAAEDCYVIVSFFISNFNITPDLSRNPKIFNRTIVHAFAQFQSCLRHSMQLNALLGYPYKQTKPAQLFNGTLLYNLYNNFKKRKNIEDYISLVLQHSESMLQLYNCLLMTGKSLVPNLFNNVGTEKKFRNNRKRKQNPVENEEEWS
ncbi:protein asteroid [Orussus abietinus]|uniref:protein asteroid n=1 Tax=Orussus abietinus TaxID=222816 RepID=UPI000626B0E1|nr:protein asteroid [Orussus abietinus]